jgi:endonuclease-8
MPEGPEIAREADRIREAIEGKEATAVRFAFPHLERRGRGLAGCRVRSVRPRGKALLIAFDNGWTIYSHNQLYGRWFVRKAGALPKTRRQLRLAIETRDRWALLYSASEIDLLDEAGVAMHPYLAKLGPDALDPELTQDEVRMRLVDPRFRRRSLGALLLDQSFVAGLGNYLRSEICFEARVHPAERPVDLDAKARRRLARAILTMTRRAYETGGVTLPKARAHALRRAGSSWRLARHWVFAREGERCRRCDEPIERFDLAGRRVYACSACQPVAERA